MAVVTVRSVTAAVYVVDGVAAAAAGWRALIDVAAMTVDAGDLRVLSRQRIADAGVIEAG